MTFKNTFISVLLMVCGLSFIAYGDVKYSYVTKYTSQKESAADSANFTSEENITRFFAANKERMEYGRSNQIFNSNEVTITRCDLNQRYRIDNALKIYTASAMDAKGIINSTPTEEELAEDLPTGKVVTDFSVQKIGSEKVNGFDTQIYHVKIHSQSSGVIGNRESNYDGKMWIADMQSSMNCDSPKKLRASYIQIENFPHNKRRMTYVNTGDIDEMNKISSQLPMRQEGTAHGSTISEKVTEYSTAKLDDSLFEVPASYRKVSSDEYEKLRSKAEFDAIQKAKKAKAQ